MDTRTFDAITRRASLMTLGTAGLATLATLGLPLAGDARKNNGKRNKNKGKKQNTGNANALCKTQAGECTSLFDALCGGQEICSEILACCPFLGTCNANGFLACLFEAQLPDA